MASDVMRLHLREIRVVAVVVDTPEELRVRVESTVRRPRCPHCGFRCHRVHDTREREVRDLEVWGRRAALVWVRRRFVCGNCDSRWLEEHPEFDGRLTRRLAQRLVADAEVMTIRAVVRRHGVSWPSVNALVRAWSGMVAEHRRSRRCRVLLVDETSMRKRHRYVTVIVNADTGRTLAMVEHRSSAALSAFLMSQPHKWRRGVKVVVTDGSRAYKASVDACVPHARHVLDRFHVIRWFAAGLTAVRRDIQRREPHGVTPAFDPEVSQSPVPAAAQRRHPRRRRPGPPRRPLRRPPPPQSRLAGPTGTPRPLHRRRPPRSPRSARTVLRPLRDRRAARVPRHRRHVHRMVRRDPGLAPHPKGQQRPHRGHQQPAPSAAAHRPRVHQPSQLRSPRTADNMTRQPVPATLHPMFTRRAHLPHRVRFTSSQITHHSLDSSEYTWSGNR